MAEKVRNRGEFHDGGGLAGWWICRLGELAGSSSIGVSGWSGIMPGAVMPRVPGVMPAGSTLRLRDAVSPFSRLRNSIWRELTAVTSTRMVLPRKASRDAVALFDGAGSHQEALVLGHDGGHLDEADDVGEGGGLDRCDTAGGFGHGGLDRQAWRRDPGVGRRDRWRRSRMERIARRGMSRRRRDPLHRHSGTG